MECLVVRSTIVLVSLATLALAAGGVPAPLGAEAPVIRARFDPDAGVIPMPSDVVRDAEAGHLALPLDDPDDSAAEKELYEFLNGRDAWSVASSADVTFTGAIDPGTVGAGTLLVLERLADGTMLTHDAPRMSVREDGRSLVVDPPLAGWSRGSVVALVLRGGPFGVAGAQGEPVECDAAFYFLRLSTPLTDPEHERAFPGATAEERQETAAKLEEIRLSLAPWFDEAALRGMERNEIAALWTFTTTRDTELTMSKAMRVMPLPIDLLRNPATARIDLPYYDEDSDHERHSKEHLNRFDGFGPTMTPQFQFTAPVDPATVTVETVELWKIASPPERIDGTVSVSADALRVTFHPARPLRERAQYVLAVRDALRDADGRPVAPMSVGHLLGAKVPLLANGLSTIGAVAQDEAERLEPARAAQAAFLGAIGRDDLLAAWPYTTMSITAPLLEAQSTAERVGVPLDPQGVTSMTPFEAALDFPLGALTLWNVKTVFNGTIASPDFLDPATRARYEDGTPVTRPVPFTLTIPDSAQAGVPLPVVIFGHGLVTERRFVLAVSDALAAKGFAVIAIDFPYHGARSVCTTTSPLCLPDPLSTTGELICPNLCNTGSSCSADGACHDDASGETTPLKMFPVVKMVQATGAAFIEIDSVTNTREHFLQSVVDLGALSRSLRFGNWQTATGHSFDAERVTYLGQSLGGILGGLYAPLDPAIGRAVLNVPGAGLVPMFDESTFFRMQVEAFYARHGVVLGSADHARFQNIAHWMFDGVDPINVARHLVHEPIAGVAMPAGGREVLVQMATLDFIIPEEATLRLVEEANVPMEDYFGGHAFIVLPLEPAYLAGIGDAADFLEGTWAP